MLCLGHKADRHRVSIGFKLVSSNCPLDSEDQVHNSEHWPKEKSDKHKGENNGNECPNSQGDLKVQCLFGVLRNKAAALAIHNVNDERGNKACQQATHMRQGAGSARCAGRHWLVIEIRLAVGLPIGCLLPIRGLTIRGLPIRVLAIRLLLATIRSLLPIRLAVGLPMGRLLAIRLSVWRLRPTVGCLLPIGGLAIRSLLTVGGLLAVRSLRVTGRRVVRMSHAYQRNLSS